MSARRCRLRPSVLERDLTHLADDTLEPGRRELVERLVASAPELQERLREQRRAVAATRFAAQRERAPLTLRMGRRAIRSRRRPRRGTFTLALAGPAAIVAAILTLIAGGEPGLTVAQAATLAARPALATVAEPPDGSAWLPGLRAEGLPFPYWEDRFGWRATGARTDRIDGRAATTVFYRLGAQRIAYTIVSGRPLTSDARPTASTAGGRHIVTWLRGGRTCVLSGQNVSPEALLELASGRAPY
jgi:anti-sigma factor RsiW